MLDDPLDEVLQLKRRAIALRNRGRHEDAQALLDGVLGRLQALDAASSQDEQQRAVIRAERADSLGMKGGIFRRQGDVSAALAAYQEGVKTEGEDSPNTYNLGNVVQLSAMLSPQDLAEGRLDARIDELLARLERQVRGRRSDEWWAWADLAQFRLLRGDRAGAEAAMREGLKATGPSAAEYARPLDLLAELRAQFEQAQTPALAERAAQIGEFIAAVRPLHPDLA